jgi:pantoate--beta-alanine ligase
MTGVNFHGEGKCRPGFFRGVATVCTILFNLTQPHVAFFGQKDGMQVPFLFTVCCDLYLHLLTLPMN